jgi:hypothetical protein
MTDYNDGRWHGWNGGECPVDPKTLIHAVEENGTIWRSSAARNDWPSFRGAFRVTKPAPPKPREWWIVGREAWPSYSQAVNTCEHGEKPIHVREVLPE